MPLNEFRNLKENGSASAAELAEFLVQLRGKRPQEVLGLVAQSGLTRGMVTSTMFVAIVLAVFTVLPYAWARMTPEKARVAAEKPKAAVEAAKTPAEAPAAVEAVPTQTATPAKPSQAEIMQKLGVGEAKKSDPLANPLENRTDDLLKDLK